MTAPDYTAPVAHPQLEAIEDARIRLDKLTAEIEREQESLFRMVLDAYEADFKTEAVCRAAGFSRQRLHQVLAKEREKRDEREKRRKT